MFVMRRRFLAVIVLAFISISSAQQQTSKKSETKKPEVGSSDEISQRSFESVLSERDSLTTEIAALNTDIYYLHDAISQREEWRRAKESQKEDIERVINKSLDYAHLSGTPFDSFEKELDLKEVALRDKEKRKGVIDAELIRRADIVGPQQHFKFEMSIIFAVLVGCVIAGFFAVAFRDEQVRREIFSGQAGIQFVTLFSLVIAIILFGIIDILEGKELAALLGGLSGYILGRSTSTTSERAKPTGGGNDQRGGLNAGIKN